MDSPCPPSRAHLPHNLEKLYKFSERNIQSTGCPRSPSPLQEGGGSFLREMWGLIHLHFPAAPASHHSSPRVLELRHRGPSVETERLRGGRRWCVRPTVCQSEEACRREGTEGACVTHCPVAWPSSGGPWCLCFFRPTSTPQTSPADSLPNPSPDLTVSPPSASPSSCSGRLGPPHPPPSASMLV